MDSLCLSASDQTLIEAREILLRSKRVPTDKLRSVIARSWERCLSLGVDPSGMPSADFR